MGNKKKYYRISKISLVKQRTALMLAYPESKVSFDKSSFIWSSQVRPTSLSNKYHLIIKYSLNEYPDVWVEGDNLEKLDALDFPHKYEIDKERNMVRICLYFPGQWNKSKYISTTIVPWAIEWLYFYEVWLATGKWCGGGFHPRCNATETDVKEKAAIKSKVG